MCPWPTKVSTADYKEGRLSRLRNLGSSKASLSSTIPLQAMSRRFQLVSLILVALSVTLLQHLYHPPPSSFLRALASTLHGLHGRCSLIPYSRCSLPRLDSLAAHTRTSAQNSWCGLAMKAPAACGTGEPCLHDHHSTARFSLLPRLILHGERALQSPHRPSSRDKLGKNQFPKRHLADGQMSDEREPSVPPPGSPLCCSEQWGWSN